MNDSERILHELVLNWKLRLVVSALFSMLGLAFLVAVLSGYFAELKLLDQTIVGVAVFIVMIPIYLVIADLPKIDEQTIAEMLNEYVPEFEQKADIILKAESELSTEELQHKDKVEKIYRDRSLYRYLPNRPIKQAAILMIICLSLTATSYFFVI